MGAAAGAATEVAFRGQFELELRRFGGEVTLAETDGLMQLEEVVPFPGPEVHLAQLLQPAQQTCRFLAQVLAQGLAAEADAPMQGEQPPEVPVLVQGGVSG